MVCVLIVDDEPRVVRFLRVSLSAHGYQVITASSGEEALRVFETEKPDVVVLDVVMPGMSGLKVLRAMRAASDVPIIVSSARGGLDEEAMSLGATSYMKKPFLPEELANQIRSLLSK